MAVGNQSTEEIDHKIDGAAVSCVFNLGDILELIDNGFDQRSFAQQEFVGHRQELIFHVGSQLGNQLQVEECPQLTAELFGEVSSVGKQFTKQVSYQPGYGFAIIDVGWG